MTEIDFHQISTDIKKWGVELGFQEVSFTDIDLSKYEHHLKDWIDRNYHGAMSYMAENHDKRCHPEQLVPGTIRVVCVRMDYAMDSEDSLDSMQNTGKAYISRYARGRDYHKLIRKRLQKLARKIQDVAGPFGYRAFVDSAPVLERALAEKAGMGWIGKNTMLINKQAGSWFFLGELFTDLPLPVDEQVADHCGSCSACLDICPTNAFVKPNLLDATRCISYLTIELRTSIPVEFRKPMGNRIYGCDDCQFVCPWNKFSKPTQEKDFTPRHSLDDAQLVDLFAWSEREFLKRTEGSAIRRIGYDCWLRNIAVALGNAPSSKEIVNSLRSRLNNVPDMVNEHIEWALLQHES
ncbi:MAG: tRNA epoxyqueuosine(34) reductase QueG [Gammaproteobacteria bacterium]|nr:tRNA epoxyqueuosine(34) reductase QueG [Gammaproteobacteria bacterium]